MFVLTFSHIKDGKRQQLIIDGKVAQIIVEATSKTGAINHPDTVKFCEEYACSVRSVS